MSNLRQTVAALGPEENFLLANAIAQVASAAAALGVQITGDEIAETGAMRDHVLSPDGAYPLDVPRALAELRELESVALKLKAASSDAKARKEIEEYARTLAPAERMTWARKIGADKPQTAPANATAIGEIKDRAGRMAAYRRAGGTK